MENSPNKKTVSVLGCGRWGTFLAWYSDTIGLSTTLWGRKGSQNLAALQKNGANDFLTLNPSVALTDDLEAAIHHAELIIISINAQNLRSLLEQVAQFDLKNKCFVLCMKGIEIGSNLRLSEVFEQVMQQYHNIGAQVAVWVGPGHVQSFVKGVPNCMVIDSKNASLTNELISIFTSDLIRFYIGGDLIGNEIGAAAKNCIGIAAGMLDGLNLTSLKGALMARAPREIARLIKAMGGDEVSAYGLAHLGDYEATLFSKNSNNRAFGEDYICGKKFEKLAEGVSTLKALHFLALTYGIDMPITDCLYSIFYENADSQEALNKLFLRPIKQEFY